MAYVIEQSSYIVRFAFHLAAVKFKFGNNVCFILIISILLIILKKGWNYLQVHILFLYGDHFLLIKSLFSKRPKNSIKNWIKFKWSYKIKFSHFPKTKVSAKSPIQEVETQEGKKRKKGERQKQRQRNLRQVDSFFNT